MKESKQDIIKKKLAPYRRRIDKIDDRILELLDERFGIARVVAALKKRDNIHIIHPKRVQEVKDRNVATAKKYGIPHKMVLNIYELIIGEMHKLEISIKGKPKKKKATPQKRKA